MELKLIYGGDATLEDFYDLYEKKGIAVVIGDGKVESVLTEEGDR